MFRTLFTSAIIIAAMSTQASAINIQDAKAVAQAWEEIKQGHEANVDAGQTAEQQYIRNRAADIDYAEKIKSGTGKPAENAGSQVAVPGKVDVKKMIAAQNAKAKKGTASGAGK